jgi:hypothetical protein
MDDPQEYVDALSQLSSDNVFSTATNAVFADPEEPPSAEESKASTTTSSRNNIAGIVGAAAGFMLLTAGIFLYRRVRHSDEQDNRHQKRNKTVRGGDATVAGETLASGETLDGNASISPSTGSFRDEDNNIITLNKSSAENDIVDTNATPALWTRLHLEDPVNDCNYLNSPSKKHPRSDTRINLTSNQQSKTSEVSSSRKALEDFDAYVGCAAHVIRDPPLVTEPVGNVPSETNQVNVAKGRSLDSSDSTSTRLWYDQNMGVIDVDRKGGAAFRRPRTVAEIEALLAIDAGVQREKANSSRAGQ